ncbi:MAG: ATPase/protein kinase family protein [Bryobacterales bacterium]|nr:ATPase/protein kinase family protein [Bryobacterales bacterium]
MSPERQRRIEEIYAAVSQPGIPDKHAFLLVQCGADTELRREVESLLTSSDSLKSETREVEPARPARPLGAAPIRRGSILGQYEILGTLGQGGMGVVYEALDQQRSIRVALKSLSGFGPRALRLFKNEFRALSGISHPNLATLYELVFCDGQWLFSMEYVEGGHFLDYVRPGATAAELTDYGPDAETVALDYHATTTLADPSAPARRGRGGRCDMKRLGEAVSQLTSAVLALHAQGILHRDLKPLNVKVTPAGRVVVLDFGLATHAAPVSFSEESILGGVVGTVAYMSPEQASGEHVTEATDWYAVGVMLYEALTGHRPFEGPADAVMRAKRKLDAPKARLGAGVSPVWREICSGLLERDPMRRLGGTELLARLQRLSAGEAYVQPSAGQPILSDVRAVAANRRFFGRESHLAKLSEALSDVAAGHPSVVLVRGPSGIGKSALIDRFLNDIAGEHDPAARVILTGRCYESESMPYKAVDGVIDRLAKYMAGLPRHEAAALAPRDASALVQVFPVLRQVHAIALAPHRPTHGSDEYELRRKAFSALREILARLGDRRQVIIWIDDLQWGDTDSAALLRELLRPPETPALLLIGSYRSDPASRTEFGVRSGPLESNAVLQTILLSLPGAPEVKRHELVVGPLTAAETRTLAGTLLGHAPGLHDERVERIASESEGSPYLLHEIAAALEAGAAIEAQSGATLDELLYQRVLALPEVARRLIQLVALAARPVSEREVFRAAGLPAQDPGMLVLLRAGRLIRRGGGSDDIQSYHDRVRETVAARLLEPDKKTLHGALAETFEDTLKSGGCADSEAIAVHFEGAGDRARASQYYAAASDTAAAALAFKHGAELCQRAFDLSPATGEERRRLTVKLADALAKAGLGPRAAFAYREAAQGARDAELFDLESKEAYWFASSGHVDAGQDAMAKMLRRIGVSLPGRLRRIAGIFYCVVWLRVRGTKFRERPQQQISQAELHRVDVLWNVASGYGMIDTPTGIYAVGQCVRASLRLGEPLRIARAFALYSVGSSAIPVPVKSPIPEILRACTEICERSNSPYHRGLLRVAEGFLAFFEGKWLVSIQRMDEAERILDKECGGVALELAMARIFLLWNLLYCGSYLELARRAPLWSQEGRDRGDLFQTTSINMGPGPVCELIADRPDSAMKQLDDALQGWTRRYVNLQHASGTYIRAWIYLYRGEPEAATAVLDLHWRELRLNLYHRLAGIRQWLYSSRAQATLAVGMNASDPRAAIRLAERDAEKLEKDEAPFAHALAKLVRAGCASLRGDTASARSSLEGAIAQLDALDMTMIAASARWRLGEMLGGGEGQALFQEAGTAMKAVGVQNPARMTAIFVNGCTAANSPAVQRL